MQDKTPSALVKDLDGQVRRILRPIDVLKLGRKDRESLTDLRQVLTDARIYTNGYELSETREEQQENAIKAKFYLEKARKDILSASENDIFGAVDVAQLTAVIDHIQAELK